MLQTKRKTNKKRKKTIIFGLGGLLILGVIGASYVFLEMHAKHPLISPVIIGINFNIGSKNEGDRVKDIESFLNKERILYQNVKNTDTSTILVSLKDNGEVYLSSDNYAEELTSLQVIVSRLTMEGKRFKRLDLRFERPVIVM